MQGGYPALGPIHDRAGPNGAVGPAGRRPLTQRCRLTDARPPGAAASLRSRRRRRDRRRGSGPSLGGLADHDDGAAEASELSGYATEPAVATCASPPERSFLAGVLARAGEVSLGPDRLERVPWWGEAGPESRCGAERASRLRDAWQERHTARLRRHRRWIGPTAAGGRHRDRRSGDRRLVAAAHQWVQEGRTEISLLGAPKRRRPQIGTPASRAAA